MRAATLAGLAALVVVLAGCPEEEVPGTIDLYSITVAPAARQATMVTSKLEHSIKMSRGVALGIGCWDNCQGACEAPTFTVANPDVAAVLPVYRATGYPTWALVARTAGNTEITVANACATQVYTLAVADDQL